MTSDIRIPPKPRVVVDRRVAERKRPVKTAPDRVWTPMERAWVMHLIAQGKSRSEVANSLGCNRNSICGVVTRERTKRLAEAQGRAA